MSILISHQRLYFYFFLKTHKFIIIKCKTIPSGLTIKCIKAMSVDLHKSKPNKIKPLQHQKISELNHNLRNPKQT